MNLAAIPYPALGVGIPRVSGGEPVTAVLIEGDA